MHPVQQTTSKLVIMHVAASRQWTVGWSIAESVPKSILYTKLNRLLVFSTMEKVETFWLVQTCLWRKITAYGPEGDYQVKHTRPTQASLIGHQG